MNRSAFRFLQPANTLPFDGERFVSGLLGDVSSGDIQSEHYHRYLFALQFCREKDVLDVASGEGYGSHCLGQVARSVIGVDSNDEAVGFANRTYLTDRVSFKVGTAHSLPIDNTSIDVVISFETLEHIEEHEAFAAEIRRVLRPGGLLLISSPNRRIYTEEADYHNEWHLRELDRGEFVDYLSGSFANVRMFAQRPLAGSVIAIDDAQNGDRPEGFILRGEGVFHRTDGVPHPPFFVALASDAELPQLRSSVLQNPALLRHIDLQRQKAAEEAAQAMSEVASLRKAAEEAAQAMSEVTSLRKAAEEAAQAISQIASLEAAVAKAQRDIDLQRQKAEETQSALSRVGRERIDAIRQELVAARRRNVQLASETDDLRRERDNLRRERDDYALRLERLIGSTAWKATWPLRWFGLKLPPGVRRRLISGVRRLLRSGARNELRPVTSQGPATEPVSETPDPGALAIAPNRLSTHGAVEPRPSDTRRQLDASRVEPNERPEFIRLRAFRSEAKIAVVAHIYYPEVWQELMDAVLNIPEDFDLFVTLVIGASEGLAPTIRERFPRAHVLSVENHGRDMLPFLTLLRSGVLFNYELVCKIHSKRSTHREGGDSWRRALVGGILGSTGLVEQILCAFRSDPDLGLVVAPKQFYGGRAFWISNERRASQLFREIGLNETAFEPDFVGGSMYWIRPFILRTIDSLRLGHGDFEPEPIPNDGLTAHAVERLVSLVCYDAGMRAAESDNLGPTPPKPLPTRVHVIANYLPQFHPIPENDTWWGKGFTEWTNVTKAVPLFKGHRQPRLATDLGFYDLRLPETRIAQAELARNHGITAFSYYYYWFNGQKLLNRPIEEVVASGQPDFPFMLCWANEPWTRNWDGLSEEVLLAQDYAPDWECAFAADVARIMRDPRYLRLDGKPMLALYRVAHFPDKIGSIARLREAFGREGFPAVHLIGGWVRFEGDEALPNEPSELGLDAYFEFPPHHIPAQPLEIPDAERVPGFAAHIYDYGATVGAVIDQLALGLSGFRYRGVMMGWDNTPRRGGKSHAFHGATPANFRRWLRAALRSARSEARGPETAVFINAWNEWAEGAYLEPDRDFGMGWLEAVASATIQDKIMVETADRVTRSLLRGEQGDPAGRVAL